MSEELQNKPAFPPVQNKKSNIPESDIRLERGSFSVFKKKLLKGVEKKVFLGIRKTKKEAIELWESSK